jgi:anti-sigma factor RsiW
MNDVRKEELIRLSMRRDLTPEEELRLEEYFAADAQARAAWDEERALSHAVQSLPDVPVSSNFTSRVLQAIDLAEQREKHQHASKPWFQILLPRLTAATVAVLLVFFILQQQQRATTEAERFKAVSAVSTELKRLPLPEPGVLQDFEAINRLRRAVPSDDELLIALQ